MMNYAIQSVCLCVLFLIVWFVVRYGMVGLHCAWLSVRRWVAAETLVFGNVSLARSSSLHLLYLGMVDAR